MDANRPERAFDHSPPPGVEITNEWSYTSNQSPYVFMERAKITKTLPTNDFYATCNTKFKSWTYSTVRYTRFMRLIIKYAQLMSIQREVLPHEQVKIKLSPVHTMKAYRDSGGIAPPILNHGTRRR